MQNRGDEFLPAIVNMDQRLSKISSPVGCFCNPFGVAEERRWGTSKHLERHPTYDERALAQDLNSLSFNERQNIELDIHGVADEVPETPDFIAEKLHALRGEIRKLSPGLRRAYDRAVFLRPQIASDDSFFLMLLRAKRFDPAAAAYLMAIYYQSKLELFGDTLLVKRITLTDLTENERETMKGGCYLHLHGQERKGRVILYSRIAAWDLLDPIALVRRTWYINSAIEDDDEQQRKGAILMLDLTGHIKHTPMEIVKFFAMIQRHMETILFRVDSVHLLYDNAALDTFFKSLFGVLRSDLRLRHRFHFGSSLEIQYSLRTFGINIEDCIGPRKDSYSQENIRKYLERRLPFEEARRRQEELFTAPTSKIALYPNHVDILLGRHKIALTWPGNLMYNKLIESQAPRYIAVNGQDRVEKTLIAFQTIHVLQREYGARFLTRKDDYWETTEDADVQPKVSQSLRAAARGMTKGAVGYPKGRELKRQ